MEQLQDILHFIITDGALVVAIASAICAVTKTPDKGTAISHAYKILDLLALNVGKAKDKEKDKSSF